MTTTNLRSIRVTRALLGLALVGSLAACGGGDAPAGPGGAHTIRLATSQAQAGTPITLHVRPANLSTASFAGALGTTAVSFARLDDSTVVGLLPDVVAGAHTLTVAFPSDTASLALTVIAAEAIAVPAQVIAQGFDAVLARLALPAPPGADSTWWSADSAALMTRLSAAARDAAGLPAAEQLALARILNALAREGSVVVAASADRANAVVQPAIADTRGTVAPAPRGDQPAVRAPLGSVDLADGLLSAAMVDPPTECEQWVDTWQEANRKAKGALGGMASGMFGLGTILRTIGAATYGGGFASGLRAAHACAMPYDLTIEEPALYNAGTYFWISASRRTFTAEDADRSPTAQRYMAAKVQAEDVHRALTASGALPPVTMARVPDRKPTTRDEIDRSTVRLKYDYILEAGTGITAPNGTPNTAPAILSNVNGWLLLDARSRMPDELTARVPVTITINGLGDIDYVLPVPVQRCPENSLWYRSCSYRVAISPAADVRKDLSTGQTRQVTGAVYDKQGYLLQGRRVRWSTGPGSFIKLSATEGVTIGVTGVSVTSPGVPTSIIAEPLDAGADGQRTTEFFNVVSLCTASPVGVWTANGGSYTSDWTGNPLPFSGNSYRTYSATLTIWPDLTFDAVMQWNGLEPDGSTGTGYRVTGLNGATSTGPIVTSMRGTMRMTCESDFEGPYLRVEPVQGVQHTMANTGRTETDRTVSTLYGASIPQLRNGATKIMMRAWLDQSAQIPTHFYFPLTTGAAQR